MIQKILTEAVVVSIALVVVGMLIHLFVNKFMKHDMNNNVVLGTHFFIAGFVVHLLAEYSGMNKWYCKNGSACSS